MSFHTPRRLRVALLPLTIAAGALTGVGHPASADAPHLDVQCTATATVEAFGSTFQTAAAVESFIPAYEAACPTHGTVSYNGIAGTSSVACTTYVTTGALPSSPAGYTDATPFCGTDAALDAAQWQAANARTGLTGQAKGVHHIPVAVGAVAIVFNSADCSRPDVALPEIASWYQGGSTGFPDGCTTTGTPEVVARSDGSGTTCILKRYLGHRDADFAAWNLTHPCTSTTWPGSGPDTFRAGNAGVADYVNANPGSLGYVDLAEALKPGRSNLVLARVKTPWEQATGLQGEYPLDTNPDSTFQNSARCDGAVAVPPSTLSPGWDQVDFGDTQIAYPICGFTYALIFDNWSTVSGQPSPAVSADQVRVAVDYLIAALNVDRYDLFDAHYGAMGPVAQRIALNGLLHIRP